MRPVDLNDFIEFDDRKVNPVVLANEPDMRLLLLCMRAGQRVPEHSAAGSITVQSVTGRATFYDGEEACEMFAGSLVRLEAGRPHRVEAHTDAARLVTMITPPKAGAGGGAPHGGARRRAARGRQRAPSDSCPENYGSHGGTVNVSGF